MLNSHPAVAKPIIKSHSRPKKRMLALTIQTWHDQIRKLQHKGWWPHLIWTPLIILVIYVALFGVDIPFGDPWATLLPHIVKAYQGTLSLTDLLSQNNEHRPLMPRLILLPLALLTHWSTRVEMGVEIGFSVATFLVIRRQLSLSWKRLATKPSDWLLMIIALLVFSLNQWENWLNGYQVLFSLHAFASVSGLFLLANPDLTSRRFALGLLCAVVTHYTIATGIVLWGVGLMMILITTGKKGRKALFALIWLAAALISSFLYFENYHRSSDLPALSIFLSQPHIYLLYVFTFLGAPVMTFYTASIPGVVGTGLLTLITAGILRRRSTEERKVYLPYIALCLYTLLIALAIGVGRMGEKWWLALSPRYVGLSVWFWVGLVSLLFLKASIAHSVDHPSRLDLFWRRFATPFFVIIAAFSIICSVLGFGLGIYLRYIPLSSARNALVAGDESAETLMQIYPDPTYLRQQLLLIKQYHLSIYRSSAKRLFGLAS